MNMQNNHMDEVQFARLVACYGGEIHRFPEEYQAAAHQLLAHSEAARKLQHDELQLDNLLNKVTIPPPSAQLRQRILRKVRAAAPDIWHYLWQWMIGSTPLEYVWRPALTLVLPLLLGFLIGFYSMQNVNDESTMATTAQIQTTSIEQEMDWLGLTQVHSEQLSEWE